VSGGAAPWEVVRLAETRTLPGPGTLRWAPLRRTLGITAFGVNAYVAAERGQDVVEPHEERSLGHEELYLVVAGRAVFTLDGEELDVPAGTLVYLRDPAVQRAARAAEPGTIVLAVGGAQGRHEPSAWEWSFAAYGHAQEGELERGLEVLREGLAVKPDARARLLYDLACLEALAGRADPALERLAEAVELDPSNRERARRDPDLASLRCDPRFPA
jgi:tetratricopeptide (TPR) repeat protein